MLIVIKYTINITCLNHPETIPRPPAPNWVQEKIVFHKTVPGAKKVGDHCFIITFLKIYLHIRFMCFITLPRSFCISLLHLLIFSVLFIFLVTPSGLWNVNFLTKDQTCGPLQQKCRVLTTGSPGKLLF